MFRELLLAYERFKNEGKIPPTAYKPKDLNWIVELGGAQSMLTGPFRKGEVRTVLAPDRQRSGKVSASNLKPFLLLDKAQYTLGKAPPGREHETRLVHSAFLELLDTASSATCDPELAKIRDFAATPPQAILDSVGPNDLVAVRVDASIFPFERPQVQDFWAEYLGFELASGAIAACCICSAERPVQRILPRELVLFGQKCQAMSVNTKQQPAFGSFGRSQLENSPLCGVCANAVVDTFDYMIRTRLHNTTIVRVRVRPNGPLDPFRSQLAVYWLSRPIQLREQGQAITEDALSAVLAEDFQVEQVETTPQAELQHVENLLKIPWSPKDASLNLSTENFHLAVLSANKARLVVREWLSVSLADLRETLCRFLAALRLIGFYGDEPRARSIAVILEALDSHDPNMARGLLRTAYLGHAPPSALLVAAARRLAVLYLKGRQDRSNDEHKRVRHIEALTSAVKLALFYGKEDGPMDQINRERKTPPYLCGQLLAVLEQAQQIAHWVRSRQELNRTIVDRFYGSASTAPCSVFGNLIRQATTAHLPDAGDVNVLMEDVMRDIDEAGGFPATLTAPMQAEFGLGFFHQRSDFRAKRKQKAASKPAAEGE